MKKLGGIFVCKAGLIKEYNFRNKRVIKYDDGTSDICYDFDAILFIYHKGECRKFTLKDGFSKLNKPTIIF